MPISFSLAQDYDVPPARVFRALTDLEEAAAWLPGCVRIERVDEGPLAVGCRYRETRRVFGRVATEEFEVTRIEAPHALALRCDGALGTTGHGQYRFDYTLEPQAGGTRVVLHGELSGVGGLWELIGRVFAGTYRGAIEKDMIALRRHLMREAMMPLHD